MSSIGKINASLVGATQETTLTLANLNFDFSLYKVEAPTEYQDVGKCLSKRRLDAAEGGNEHVFARKLGALFSNVVPSTPNLVRVYGKRASEIVREVSSDSSVGSAKQSIFMECIGPDATSIWAAATSGSGAISAHLLACMLARIWTASEAEAIWDEIIQVRKRLLLEIEPSDPLHPAATLAAQIEITRSQISSWDASARAWLEVADRSRLRQQKQLLLLVERAGIPLKQGSDTYSSVIEAWITALKTMEAVVSGVAQSIRDASIILALTSWHLYPDMFVLGAGSDPVAQHDPLLPAEAKVTLGQSSYTPGADSLACWSLPLAYLKYYGDPVLTTRTIGESTSRLSVPEFAYVVFGSVIANWGVYGNSVDRAAEFFVALNACLIRNGGYHNRGRRSWTKLLAEAADAYLTSSGIEQQMIHGLMMRGHRRYKTFLSEDNDTWRPLFGVADVNTLMKLVKSREERVCVLRLAAKGLTRARPDSVIIRYPRPRDSPTENSHFSNAFPFQREAAGDRGPWEYATALKRGYNPRKRKFEPEKDLSGHVRWSSRDPASIPGCSSGEEHRNLDTVTVSTLNSRLFKWSSTSDLSFLSTRTIPLEEKLYECIMGDPADAAIFKRSETHAAGSEMLDIEAILTVLHEDWIDVGKLVDLLDLAGQFQLPRVPQYLHCLRAIAAAADVYKLMPGASLSTHIFSAPLKDALWMPSGRDKQPSSPGTEDSASSLDQEVQAKGSLIHGTTLDPRLLSIKRSLSPVSNIVRIGSRSEDADTICRQLITYELTRPQAFSCIAMFENRSVNIDPNNLEQVMAISTGNSIYVAMPLICDPFDSPSSSEVKHIVGNIGRPGVSLMIPPMMPKVRRVDESQWVMINHADFDGRLDDAFQQTTLHLSFTRYQLPVKSSHGYQGVEANFVETLVSVFDREEWVADLDVLKALDQPWLERDVEESGPQLSDARVAEAICGLKPKKSYTGIFRPSSPAGKSIYSCQMADNLPTIVAKAVPRANFPPIKSFSGSLEEISEVVSESSLGLDSLSSRGGVVFEGSITTTTFTFLNEGRARLQLPRCSFLPYSTQPTREGHLHERTLELRQQAPEGKHPDTTSSLADLAPTYNIQGRYEKAEKIYKKVLELRQEVLREKHPDTISSVVHFAATYHTRDWHGRTPLSRVADRGHKTIIDLPLNRGANDNTQDSGYGALRLVDRRLDTSIASESGRHTDPGFSWSEGSYLEHMIPSRHKPHDYSAAASRASSERNIFASELASDLIGKLHYEDPSAKPGELLKAFALKVGHTTHNGVGTQTNRDLMVFVHKSQSIPPDDHGTVNCVGAPHEESVMKDSNTEDSDVKEVRVVTERALPVY
ncbi:hypothetical protein FSARC_11373 [Fusarium sarcochroum]|uniref:Uncharacterized protein n=1 Tax=Fusarium sarcochroum TaxID=1208366 RepID=A0A8H4TG58_9HYPO|nr:hypothetical protein FSARC_11373 [Fusarium sarcochroum]